MTTTAGPTIWFDRPDESWLGGLPVGNGRSGAMIYGKPQEQVIALNDEEFWSPGTAERDFTGARDALESVRRLLRAGDVLGAQAEAGPLLGHPRLGAAFQPLGSLAIQTAASAVEGYRRELDVGEGAARVTWLVDGSETEQTLVAVRDPSVFVLAQRGNPHPSSLQIRSPFALSTHDGLMFAGEWAEVPPNRTLVADSYRLTDFAGRRLRFGIGVRILSGSTEFRGGALELAPGGWAIAIAVGTDRRRGNPADEILDRLDRAERDGIDELERRGRAEHRAVFARASISLHAGEPADAALRALPTDARVQGVRAGGVDDGLMTMLADYGRYLTIASTVGGSLPPNLQGVWNEDTEPAWCSNWTLNINTQMNLWSSDAFGMVEGPGVLADFVDSLASAGRRTASEIYGADGWVVHHNSDGWFNTAPTTLVEVGLFPAAGLWLIAQLWQHHEHYPERRFADRLLPLLEGAIEFLETWLVEGADGLLVTLPSSTPENGYLLGDTPRPRRRADDPEFWRHGWIGEAPTLDMMLIRDTLAAGIEAGTSAGLDPSRIAAWRSMLDRLPPITVDDDGQISEWTSPRRALEVGHRHLSRLYGVYPGNDDYRAPSPLVDAAIRSLVAHQTGVESSSNGWGGWSRVWAAGVWARLGDGDRALASLESLMRTGIVPGSLLHAFPEFDGEPASDAVHQSDANMGVPAVLAEMLLQSGEGEVRLLPALPSRWRAGEVRSLRARGGIDVSFTWSDGAITRLELTARRSGPVSVVMPAGRFVIELSAHTPHVKTFGGAKPPALEGPRP